MVSFYTWQMSYHVQEMIPGGKGATRRYPTVHLSRFACYLLATWSRVYVRFWQKNDVHPFVKISLALLDELCDTSLWQNKFTIKEPVFLL